MKKLQKQYTLRQSKYMGKTVVSRGTVNELTKKYKHTLEVGKSWEQPNSRSSVNLKPKTFDELVFNLNKADEYSNSKGFRNNYYEQV